MPPEERKRDRLIYCVPVLDAFFTWAENTFTNQDNLKKALRYTLTHKKYFTNFFFPYELEQRYKKMRREDDDYCELIYECLYEESVAMYNELSDSEFKKLMRKQYNYIKKIAKEGFY